jgi:hypothetical protein
MVTIETLDLVQSHDYGYDKAIEDINSVIKMVIAEELILTYERE